MTLISAGALIINHEGHVLITLEQKMNRDKVTSTLRYDFPKGKYEMDKDKDIKDTAQREVLEEVGCVIDKDKLNDSRMISIKLHTGKQVFYYVISSDDISHIDYSRLDKQVIPSGIQYVNIDDLCNPYGDFATYIPHLHKTIDLNTGKTFIESLRDHSKKIR